ncbi:MAG: DUF3422 domain-containing protein [Azovibrio sp.]|uniref:DUF3422 family protein n=1 Tax=Azovibrio sp. TaxID=1872673 RepID=UPI003C734881
MSAPFLLHEHPLRQRLNNELHARPPMSLGGPAQISYLAMLHEGHSAADEEAHLRQLCDQLGLPFCPLVDGDHWVMEAGDLRLKWERHTEFSGYTFFRACPNGVPETGSALEAFPTPWWQAIPGQVMVATHLSFVAASQKDPEPLLAELIQSGATVAASQLANGAAWVVSDFRLYEGFSRFTVIDSHLRPRQAGRTIQRLLEIETYRMMALLAFPVAKEVGQLLNRVEKEVAELMTRMGEARSPEDERLILADLTRLAAEVEHSQTRTSFRFGAAEAYYRLVLQRIGELREVRLDGFSPIREFMDRRLAPAINTCLSAARRQNDASTRIARKSALLRTRVDIELERQNQKLLTQMNRRASLQLRLQETVESLSVVVLTYYGSQLINYLAKGSKAWHHLNSDVVTALSIPVIAGLVFWGSRRMRKKLALLETD